MASTHRSNLLQAWVRDTSNDPLKCALWAASIIAMTFMALADDLHGDLESFCITGPTSRLAEGWVMLRLFYTSLDLTSFGVAVGLMLVAMMAPGLQGPLLQMWRRLGLYLRGPAVVLFLSGYFGVWLLGSALLVTAALLLIALCGSQVVAGLLALLVAGVWQISALRARCLSRCHLHGDSNTTGAGVWRASLGLGLMHGVWCCATCWPLMLIAFCVPALHLPLMLVGAVIIARERGQRLHA